MISGKKLRISILPAFLCLLSMLVVACGGGGGSNNTSNQPQKAADNKQVLVVPLAGVTDIKTFDPALSTDLNSISAIDLVYTGLVQLDDNLNVRGQLAQSYSVGSDGVTWTFHLKPNLKFSDGTALTANDVIYSINRALDPALGSAVSPAYLNLVKDSDKRLAKKVPTLIGDSLMAPDANTVVIVTNKQAQYFLDALTYSCSYVVEQSKVGDIPNGGGGAGPFIVKNYAHGKEIDFVPNPNYYDKGPQLKEIRYVFYKEADTAYRAYQAAQIDSAGVPSTDLAAAKQLTNEFHSVPQLWINYYTMNYLVKPFDNIKIRQAFDLAINKDVIAHDVYKDTVFATNHIVPKGMPGYNQNLTGPQGAGTSGNQSEAKTLFQQGLQEEGYSSVSQLPPITLTVSSGGSTDVRNELAAEQQMWQSTLGVSVKIDDEDFNKLLSDILAATNNPKGLQFWGIAWIADYPDPQDWTTLQFANGAPNNNMNYGQNKTSDAAAQVAVQNQLVAADTNSDKNARLQQYYDAEQKLINDVAWLPIDQVTSQIVRKPCVTGVVDNAQSLTPPDDWANVYISTNSNCANVSVNV
jgi:peptide/nickel transport system substrate-binding protein/oligopeptide transport system substrate-binding protein